MVLYRDNIDIFCDASVSSNKVGACAGCLTIDRNSKVSAFDAVILPNGTNNSGEIAALTLAVQSAIGITLHAKKQNLIKPAINIFSDSLISIRGVREWIFDWLSNAQGNKLYKSNGQPVMNQRYIKLIYTLILVYRPDIHFYHQKAHVERNFDVVVPAFLSTNGVTLESVGLTPEYISIANSYVDAETRRLINQYVATEKTEGYPVDHYKSSDNDTIVSPLLGNDPKYISLYRRLIHAGRQIGD